MWKSLKASLPRRMGIMAVYHSKSMNWNSESFVDRPPKRWPKKRAKYGGKTLVKTGRLKRSMRILKLTRNRTEVGTNVGYGIKHQEGRGRFPERQFTGHSQILAEATARLLVSNLNKAMRV
jgi:phage gpG-like protein